ncbi:hypothetical protein HDV05_004517 [Chytridiales sp. JEL 0842]|nr:hypothetical protein HDV05_004517 [Chytridiales sp. JEL 0842]
MSATLSAKNKENLAAVSLGKAKDAASAQPSKETQDEMRLKLEEFKRRKAELAKFQSKIQTKRAGTTATATAPGASVKASLPAAAPAATGPTAAAKKVPLKPKSVQPSTTNAAPTSFKPNYRPPAPLTTTTTTTSAASAHFAPKIATLSAPNSSSKSTEKAGLTFLSDRKSMEGLYISADTLNFAKTGSNAQKPSDDDVMMMDDVEKVLERAGDMSLISQKKVFLDQEIQTVESVLVSTSTQTETEQQDKGEGENEEEEEEGWDPRARILSILKKAELNAKTPFEKQFVGRCWRAFNAALDFATRSPGPNSKSPEVGTPWKNTPVREMKGHIHVPEGLEEGAEFDVEIAPSSSGTTPAKTPVKQMSVGELQDLVQQQGFFIQDANKKEVEDVFAVENVERPNLTEEVQMIVDDFEDELVTNTHGYQPLGDEDDDDANMQTPPRSIYLNEDVDGLDVFACSRPDMDNEEEGEDADLLNGMTLRRLSLKDVRTPGTDNSSQQDDENEEDEDDVKLSALGMKIQAAAERKEKSVRMFIEPTSASSTPNSRGTNGVTPRLSTQMRGTPHPRRKIGEVVEMLGGLNLNVKGTPTSTASPRQQTPSSNTTQESKFGSVSKIGGVQSLFKSGTPLKSAKKKGGVEPSVEIPFGPLAVGMGTGGSLTVLTPRRAKKKEREELGVDSVVTSARRSMRLFREPAPVLSSDSEGEDEEDPNDVTITANNVNTTSSPCDSKGSSTSTSVSLTTTKTTPSKQTSASISTSTSKPTPKQRVYTHGPFAHSTPQQQERMRKLLECNGMAYVPNKEVEMLLEVPEKQKQLGVLPVAEPAGGGSAVRGGKKNVVAVKQEKSLPSTPTAGAQQDVGTPMTRRMRRIAELARERKEKEELV